MTIPATYTLKRGDYVTIIQGDERLRAMVVIASGNGQSILLMFDGVLHTQSGGLIVQMAPLYRKPNGTWVEIVEETPIELELQGPGASHPRDNAENN